eukprot:TRINITY_DN5224_c0_g2_i2.p1 TRINITY_DN5224_c0_g2~~TRINITY_DN5224_c0_g2_i2.p1  ORF type:complete len:322 (+),score=46.66 TRINITY_DN5224_c0_g2_i2:47-967(+)
MPKLPLALVGTEWLASRLSSVGTTLRVFDCTTRLEQGEQKPYKAVPARDTFEESRIQGAEFIDLVKYSESKGATDKWGNDVQFQLMDNFLDAFGNDTGIDGSQHIILYSKSKPMWATRMWWMLHSTGYPGQYSVLDGGFQKWSAEKHPTESGPPKPVTHNPASITAVKPTLSVPRIVGKSEMLKLVSTRSAPYIHTLSKDSYSGGSEMYGRCGHITGAASLPFSECIDGDNFDLFKSKEELESVFSSAGIPPQPAALYAYCGGGISATVPLFAACVIMEWDCPLSLYDGSLGEWCGDVSLPMSVED